MLQPHQTTLLIIENTSGGEDCVHQFQHEESVPYRFLTELYGTQALQVCRSHPIDSILLKLYAPYSSSLDFLRQLKEYMGENCPPIIAIGSREIEVAVQAFRNGATDYLVEEQVTLDDLRLTIGSAIENIRLRRELQHSQEQFQTSVENMLDCFGIFSSMRNELGQIVDFRIDYLNKAACENNRMPREMQVGRGLCEVLPGHRESELFDEYCQLVETGEPLIKESLIYEDTYGEQQQLVRAFDIRAAKLNDGFVASWRDITDRKRLELELSQTAADLRQQQNRLQRLIDTAPIGIGIGSADGQVRVINDAMLALHGYTREEFDQQGMNWRNFTSPEFAQRIEPAMAQLRQQGFLSPEEKELLRRDGSRVSIWISATEWMDGSNEHVAFAVDLTQQKQAEAALRQSEDRLRLAIESAQLGTWDWNLVTNQLTWDVGCKAMFGLPLEAESNTEVFFEGVHPDDRERLEQVMQSSLNLASGGNYDTEYRTIGIQDGIERWVKAKGQVYFDTAGKPFRFTGILLDITQQKQAEAEREQLLEQEQAAREAAERASRIKDEFLAVLSHELRSPLNSILGWSRLLQARKLDETKTAEALATIERNARLQTQLIDDLLDIAKILRGKLSLNMDSINLVYVIEAAIDTVRTAAVAKFITLHPVLPNIGQVSGDAARLQQVIWNLLSNAVKFTPNGGHVDILLKESGGNAEITVKDTGKGISPDFLPHIFESFRQEDASTTRKYGGLGLGLAIVYQLVKAHGGTITADSPGEGLGATFTVRLPLLNVEPDLQQAEVVFDQVFNFTGIRVLIVDDEPDARELLAVILTQYGAEIMTVSSAMDVLNNLESFQPDLLISDIGMPDVDGYALIRQIRALRPENGGQIPAIALTAYAGEVDYQRAMAAGFQQHLAKPIELDMLVRAVADLIQRNTAIVLKLQGWSEKF